MPLRRGGGDNILQHRRDILRGFHISLGVLFVRLCSKLMMISAATLLTAGSAFAANKPIKITWWHAMGGDLGKEVNKLAGEFNHSQSAYKVVPVYKGNYTQTMTDAIAAYRAHQQPDILQVFDVGTGTMMAAKGAIVPVYKLMHRAGVAFSPNDYIPAVKSYYTNSRGQMLSLPFNSSTPVLYYNENEFKKAGLNPNQPPKTWEQVYKDSEKLKKAGVKCGFTTAWQSWIQLENFSAWHNVPFANKADGFRGMATHLLINSKPFVTHIAFLQKMAKQGLFQYGGRRGSASPLFYAGTCAMYMESSGGLVSIVNNAKFKVGVGMMPYNPKIDAHPQNSIVGGASLWVLNGVPKSHYKGVAEFLAFLSKPQTQAQWSQKTGYVPITKAAFQLNKKQGYYKRYPGAAVALEELSLHQPTQNSKGIRLGNFVQIRNIINEELESVWAGKKSAKQALDTAVRRGDQQLARFRAAHRG